MQLNGHTDRITAMAFGRIARGRAVLATAGWDRTVRVWDLRSGALVTEPLGNHTAWVTAVSFGYLDDGRALLATGCRDEAARVWDPSTGELISIVEHDDSVESVAFARLADGRLLLASCSADQTIKLWDPLNGTELVEFFVSPSRPRSLAFEPPHLFVGCDDGILCLEIASSVPAPTGRPRQNPLAWTGFRGRRGHQT